MPDVRYCTFLVGGHVVGLDAGVVHQVIGRVPIRHVPLAPAAIRGLTRLRGEIVPVVHLAATLGLPVGESPMTVIVRARKGLVGLSVDRIESVVDVPGADHDRVPSSVATQAARYLSATAVVGDCLMLVLDPAVAEDLGGVEW